MNKSSPDLSKKIDMNWILMSEIRSKNVKYKFLCHGSKKNKRFFFLNKKLVSFTQLEHTDRTIEQDFLEY